jgi:Domain of unknown function (DUF5666)
MKQFLMIILLGGVAWSQAVQASFSAESSPSPAPEPNAAAETLSPGNRALPLPDLLPQPNGKLTLIGGTISKVDRVRDEITLKVFGGGNMRVLFDSRTHIYSDGAAASVSNLTVGERVYLDTTLAGTAIFAKNIRVASQDATGQTTGQVISFDARSGDLILSDAISPRSVKLRIEANTVISREGQTVSSSELLSGALVSVSFLPNGGGPPVARQLSLLAAPGNTFVFVGRITHLDIHLGLVVVVDPRDQKSYEINFDPTVIQVSNSLREGATVEATTAFDGRRYMASAIKVESSPTP